MTFSQDDDLQMAIGTLIEEEAVVVFGPIMKVRRRDEPWMLVREKSLIEAARLASGPRRFTIYENPGKNQSIWRIHIIRASTGRTRCYSGLLDQGWVEREVFEDDLQLVEDLICWHCRYTFAPARERRRIEQRQGVERDRAKPPLRLKEPRKGEFGGYDEEV